MSFLLCLFEEQNRPSWKIYDCSTNRWTLLEIHVCSRNKWTLLDNYKKVAPGKKEHNIFSKTVSVAASESLISYIISIKVCSYVLVLQKQIEKVIFK